VDVVTHQRVVHARRRAHVADDHVAGIEADANMQLRLALGDPFPVQLAQHTHHFDGRPGREHRVVVLRNRRAPECHDLVADVFIERPVIFKNDVGHRLQILVEVLDEGLRGKALGYGRKAPYIRKENGKDLLFAAEFQLVRVFEKLIHDRFRYEFGECLPDVFLLALFGHNPVHGYQREGPADLNDGCRKNVEDVHGVEQQVGGDYIHKAEARGEDDGHEDGKLRNE